MDLTSASANSRLRPEILDRARNLDGFRATIWGKSRLIGEALRGCQLVRAFEVGVAGNVQAKMTKAFALKVKRRYLEFRLRFAWFQGQGGTDGVPVQWSLRVQEASLCDL